MKIQGQFGRKPKIFDAKRESLFNIVKECAKVLKQDFSWKNAWGVCEGNNFASLGLSVIDTLGALGANPHSPNEYILMNSLIERAQLTCMLLY